VLPRSDEVRRVEALLGQFPVVALLGPRQVGKATLRGRQRHGFEFKRTTAPAITKSMHIAFDDLALDSLDVVHVGDKTFPLGANIRAVALARILEDVAPLR